MSRLFSGRFLKSFAEPEWLKLAEDHRKNALHAADCLGISDIGELMDGPDYEIQGYALDLGNDMWEWQKAIDAIQQIDNAAKAKAA